jgi:hypothetical protein
MTEERKPFRFSRQVAETVRDQKGAFAYIYVLEQLDKPPTTSNHTLWRDVLIELDELERTNNEISKLQPPTEHST